MPVTLGGGGAGVISGLVFHPNALILALRRNAKLALPECNSFPEALVDAQINEIIHTQNDLGGTPQSNELVLPYCAIVALAPRMENWGVNEVGNWIPVDFVYVAKMASNSDTPQIVRNRLASLQATLFNDYHQRGGLLAPIAQMAELQVTPVDRQNSYQTFFTERAQPVIAMAMTMEFLVLESIGYG